jgi:hypothetical protein
VGAPPWSPGPYYQRPPQYEFTPEENKVLDDLSVWAGGLGIVKFIQGGLGVIGQNPIGAIVEVIVGISLMGARKGLRGAVDTQGSDIDHLLTSVDKLSTVFLVRLILAILVGGIFALAILVLAILLAMGKTMADLGGL